MEAYFAFRVATSTYAVHAQCVDHVVPVLDPVPVPTAPGHFVGIVQSRGTVVPVVDLARFLDLAQPQAEENASDEESIGDRLVVFRAHNIFLAVIVQEVLGVREVDHDSLQEFDAVDAPSSDGRHVIVGQFEIEDRVVAVLGMTALLAALGVSSTEGLLETGT